ncbi:cytochrome b subunit of formate dehydrogenase [Allocatelliglobosispora scoriae]|uniref:Cytochrome b subunit of formate dehydrogenase n=1 Tax=Allocatelliglobosispora scoriae TaxID=643052 RepID=A0A841C3A2_9ACTN|nr:hypothetical protein [Allocatelliglobosispora scoriae]MBB5873321.1 cytochrome b subunit of formate dehydrogenase [Allocatelliglobosispora scoriae]
MISAALAVIALLLVALAVLALRHRAAAGPVAVLVAGLCAAIAYDNAAVAVGRFVGFGATLETINAARYWIHDLFTPVAVIAGCALAARAGLAWFAGRPARITTILATAALIALGVATDLAVLSLQPRGYADTLRYVNEGASGPPIAAIITIVLLIAVGTAIWRRTGVAWLCLGAIAMFVAAAVGFRHFWIGNVGELLLQAAFVATLTATSRAPLDRTVSGPAT